MTYGELLCTLYVAAFCFVLGVFVGMEGKARGWLVKQIDGEE